MRALVMVFSLMCVPAVLADRGQVEIAVWTGAEFIPQEQYELSVTGQNGDDVTDQFREGRARLPYGPYRLQIDLPGFVTYKRDFDVSATKTDVLALLKLGDIADFVPGAPPTRIVGQIRNSRVPLNRRWVRVLTAQQVGRDERTVSESKVGEDGSFHFVVSNSLYDYWVLVLALDVEPEAPNGRRAKIVHAERTSAGNHRDTDLEIDLGDR